MTLLLKIGPESWWYRFNVKGRYSLINVNCLARSVIVTMVTNLAMCKVLFCKKKKQLFLQQKKFCSSSSSILMYRDPKFSYLTSYNTLPLITIFTICVSSISQHILLCSVPFFSTTWSHSKKVLISPLPPHLPSPLQKYYSDHDLTTQKTYSKPVLTTILIDFLVSNSSTIKTTYSSPIPTRRTPVLKVHNPIL